MKPVYVCKNPHEKAMQRALIQYRNPKNYDLVKEALLKAGREDLIGFDKKCLICPRNIQGNNNLGNNGYTGNNTKIKSNVKDNTNKGKSGKDNSKSKISSSAKEKQANKGKKTIRNVHKKKSK